MEGKGTIEKVSNSQRTLVAVSKCDCTEQDKETSLDIPPKGILTERLGLDTKLLTYKVFYFMFVAGFGSTFPYMALYFKQLGLNANHVGILSGVRPLVQFSSGPFWSILADMFKARKAVLLLSIIAWLFMTLALLIPQPQHITCKTYLKTGNVSLQAIQQTELTKKRSHIVTFYRRFLSNNLQEKIESDRLMRDKEPRDLNKRDHQPQDYNISKSSKLRSNKKSASVVVLRDPKTKQSNGKKVYILIRDPTEIQRTFVVFLWLIIIGEFFEAPSFVMTDTAVLQHLGERRNDYGKTRLYGSLGYSFASFGVGALLDSTRYSFCGESMNDYQVMFYIFAAVMVCAFVYAAFAFKFDNSETDTEENKKITRNGNNIICVFKIFLSCQYGFFIILTWFLGLANGLIFNFLNWFLEDLGASKLLMGTATVLRCSTIIVGFFYNSWVIEKLGYRAVFFWVLVSYIFGFLAYSVLQNPWWTLPIEVIQGFTYGTTWSTCVTFMSVATPSSGAATAQGL